MTLPFGSFPPGIMLSVFTLAYILYFGACSLNKYGKGEKENAPGKQEEVVTVESSADSGRTFYYSGPVVEKQSGCPEKPYNHTVNKQIVFQVIKIPGKKVIPAFNGSSLFSRPPPFSA